MSTDRTGEDDRNPDPVERMGQQIHAWLDRGPDWKLVDWLSGYSLPALSGEDEPYYWLAKGLEGLGELENTGGPFCARVAAFLASKPDEVRPGQRPNQVLYNLFMLCACLHCPRSLAGPLRALYARRRIQGRWRSFDLRDALLAALIENQDNRDLQPDWERMLHEGRHEYLPGNAFDGFFGLLKMDVVRVAEGAEPDGPLILEALSAMVLEHLEDDPERVPQLESLLEAVTDVYPGCADWERRFLDQAACDDWPHWALGIVGYRADFQDRANTPGGRETAGSSRARARALRGKVLCGGPPGLE
jgi:hypothetical protein